jgi:hypothetical protein
VANLNLVLEDGRSGKAWTQAPLQILELAQDEVEAHTIGVREGAHRHQFSASVDLHPQPVHARQVYVAHAGDTFLYTPKCLIQ